MATRPTWIRCRRPIWRRYVDAMGGADPILAKAHTAYAAGDYRWVAELLHQLVFADPANGSARELEAQAFEQLGFQAESALWRKSLPSGSEGTAGVGAGSTGWNRRPLGNGQGAAFTPQPTYLITWRCGSTVRGPPRPIYRSGSIYPIPGRLDLHLARGSEL